MAPPPLKKDGDNYEVVSIVSFMICLRSSPTSINFANTILYSFGPSIITITMAMAVNDDADSLWISDIFGLIFSNSRS